MDSQRDSAIVVAIRSAAFGFEVASVEVCCAFCEVAIDAAVCFRVKLRSANPGRHPVGFTEPVCVVKRVIVSETEQATSLDLAMLYHPLDPSSVYCLHV